VEPVPYATAEPEAMRIERYGNAAKGDMAFAIQNPTEEVKEVVLKLDRKELSLGEKPMVSEEWITGAKVDAEG
jgi:hypothetical protein